MSSARAESLEPRRLLSGLQPSAHEQWMVELINRARANPGAEAARYGIDLNEGLPAGTLSNTPRQPLAPHWSLVAAARGHSQWMLSNTTVSHTGSGGSTAYGRMTSAGYLWGSPSAWGENLAFFGTTGTLNLSTRVPEMHRSLFVDAGYAGRGHRLNILEADFREIGAGFATGPWTSGAQTYNALLGTQDFAATGSTVFLTGVAYDDTVVSDEFYTPGEGLAGVTVTATRDGVGTVYSNTTWDAGGYRLPLPAGTYTVRASGGALGGTITIPNVVIGSQNVKLDFRPDMATPDFATLTSGKLSVRGTSASETIAVTRDGLDYVVTLGSQSLRFDVADVACIEVDAGDGHDQVTIGSGVIGSYVIGGLGDDTLIGGAGNDTLVGAAGRDLIHGNGGDDRLDGSSHHDTINGGAGLDRIYGGDGNDQLTGDEDADRIWGGNGNDRISGMSGNDRLFGEAGNDQMYGNTGSDWLDGGTGADLLCGGAGTDTADYSTRTAPVFVSLSNAYTATTGDDGEAGEMDNVLDDIEILRGGAGDDTLSAGRFAVQLFGNDGNDRFHSTNGLVDTIDGGLGTDTVEGDPFDLLSNI
jgi:Ca2+-binding RTX toxin-like protein